MPRAAATGMSPLLGRSVLLSARRSFFRQGFRWEPWAESSSRLQSARCSWRQKRCLAQAVLARRAQSVAVAPFCRLKSGTTLVPASPGWEICRLTVPRVKRPAPAKRCGGSARDEHEDPGPEFHGRWTIHDPVPSVRYFRDWPRRIRHASQGLPRRPGGARAASDLCARWSGRPATGESSDQRDDLPSAGQRASCSS